jgi:hypothetical protein
MRNSEDSGNPDIKIHYALPILVLTNAPEQGKPLSRSDKV